MVTKGGYIESVSWVEGSYALHVSFAAQAVLVVVKLAISLA